MFNADFYPTPESVANKMLAGFDMYELAKRHILEPSAGKGDLAEAIVNKMGFSSWRAKENNYLIHCIESDIELQATIKGKGFPLVGTDFLSFVPDEKYDLIIMNPPFSNGDKHLLHAWEILEHGDIVCLLNSETLNNPYSQNRKLLQNIIAEHGTVEELGQCFTDAFRKTDVNVSLVRLHKERKENKFYFEVGQDTEKDTVFNGYDFNNNEIATKDIVNNLVRDYDKSREVFMELTEKFAELGHYVCRLGLRAEDVEKSINALFNSSPTKEQQEIAYNSFVRSLKKCAWYKVFQLTNISNLVSAGVRQEFDNLMYENQNMAFSHDNIIRILETIYLNRGNILQQCVEEAFDHMTKYYAENRVHVEGWLTNDCYKVNKRVIFPYAIDTFFSTPSIKWGEQTKLDDIDRGLAYLQGLSLEQVPVTMTKALINVFKEQKEGSYGKKIDSTYFEMKVYKKGTLHLLFKDLDLLERFNYAAAKGKNWLPDTYKEDRKRNKRADKFGITE